MANGNRQSEERGLASNIIFFVALIIAFNIAWPLGIAMLLLRFGVFKKAAPSNMGAGSKQGLRMEKYTIITGGRSSMSIEYLANAVGVSYDTALRDLQKMVAEGRFGPNAYINYVDRAVIINPAAAKRASANTAAPKNRPSGGAAGSNMVSRAAESDRKKKGEKKPASGLREAISGIAGKRDESYRGLKGLLLGLGLALTILGLFTTLVMATQLSYEPFSEVLPELLPFLGMAGGGAWCLGYRAFLKKRENRFRVYEAACVGRDFASISELASKTGVSERKCRKDLEIMIERGLLPETAYIDKGDGALILRPGASPKSGPEPEPEADTEDRYKAILREIRKLNDDIPDEDVSRRIDEMEDLTGRIFRAVQDRPEKEPQIKSFMSYYLPTTLKLLSSYAQFEQSGAQGDNISAAKGEIERILDTLVDGFRKQLDKLYESDAMDISSDIDVLETMLRRDGLTGDGSAFQVKPEGK